MKSNAPGITKIDHMKAVTPKSQRMMARIRPRPADQVENAAKKVA